MVTDLWVRLNKLFPKDFLTMLIISGINMNTSIDESEEEDSIFICNLNEAILKLLEGFRVALISHSPDISLYLEALEDFAGPAVLEAIEIKALEHMPSSWKTIQ